MSSSNSVNLTRRDFLWLEIVCIFLIVLLFIALFGELFNRDAADSVLVVSLTSLVLVCVLCLYLGSDLLERLKKLGPLELYEVEAKSIVEAFKDYDLKIKADDAKNEPWEGLRRLQYEELDHLIFLVEVENRIPKEGRARNRYFKALFEVGRAAAAQADWPRAAKRFERLVELSRGEYEPASSTFNLGLSLREWAEAFPDEQKTENLKKAQNHLSKACAEDPDDHLAPPLACLCSRRAGATWCRPHKTQCSDQEPPAICSGQIQCCGVHPQDKAASCRIPAPQDDFTARRGWGKSVALRKE